jgi:hypothetical protein
VPIASSRDGGNPAKVAVELLNHRAMIVTRGGHGHGIKADPRGFALG